MITVDEAKNIIRQQDFERKTGDVRVVDAVDHILAEDVQALIDIPAFNQSSMDGYAFAFDGWIPTEELTVTAEVRAGEQMKLSIEKGEAARVFTGAAVPVGADTVVMQEMVEVDNSRLTIMDNMVAKGNHVRLRGAEIKEGERALQKGDYLSPAAIGFLSAIGVTQVTVFLPPRVAIIITGDELQIPGNKLVQGQVYEASSFMLSAVLKQMGIKEISIHNAKDTLDDTVEILMNALDSADVVLLTGGVSVGDYDFVVSATEWCGIEQLFHRIKQRPGKPLFFGRKGNQPVFGLPGNPSSVLTCFYEYVWPVLRELTGKTNELVSLKVPLKNAYAKTNQLKQFLKGVYQHNQVDVLNAQESFRLYSFAKANCLVMLDEEMRSYEENELVEIHLLPTYG